MDSEELKEISHHRANGRPETTRGPYYHKAWWESYKGAVKGILGGLFVGGLVGGAIGGAVVATLGFASIPLTGGTTAAIMAGATLFGMYEGKDKFEKVGITTGAVAATQEMAELRMKTWVREKFTGLTNEIRDLNAMLKGEKKPEELESKPAEKDTSLIFDDDDFKTTHCEECPTKSGIYFPKVGLVGALVGAAAAAVVIASGAGDLFLHEVFTTSLGLSEAAIPAAITATSTAIGASFGINRDVFRKIFDVTDCWFMGRTQGACNTPDPYSAEHEHILTDQAQLTDPHNKLSIAKPDAGQEQLINGIVKGVKHFQQNPSFLQDIIGNGPSHLSKAATLAAQQALQSLDPTTAVRH